MSEPVISVENLTRRFGDFVAVDHVTLNVGKGEIFGFLGPSGAGKSTISQALTALVRARGREVTLLDPFSYTVDVEDWGYEDRRNKEPLVDKQGKQL